MAINQLHIENAYLAAIRKFGESETADQMFTLLMEEEIAQKTAFHRSSERDVTNAEKALESLVKDGKEARNRG